MASVENVSITWASIFRRSNRWQGTVVGEWREWLISRNNWQVGKVDTCLGDYLNQWWVRRLVQVKLLRGTSWRTKADGQSGLGKRWCVWPLIFSPAYVFPSLMHQVGSRHGSLGDSRCLKISALVAMALCWRADFISTRNLILASCLCCLAWTGALLLEASCVWGAGGCWLHWWHKGNADKICITSGSFIGKGLVAAVAGELNCAASSLAHDMEPLDHGALQVSFTVNVPQVLAKQHWAVSERPYCWEFSKWNIIKTRLKWHHSFLFHKHALHVWTVHRCFALMTCCVGLWPWNVDN